MALTLGFFFVIANIQQSGNAQQQDLEELVKQININKGKIFKTIKCSGGKLCPICEY